MKKILLLYIYSLLLSIIIMISLYVHDYFLVDICEKSSQSLYCLNKQLSEQKINKLQYISSLEKNIVNSQNQEDIDENIISLYKFINYNNLEKEISIDLNKFLNICLNSNIQCIEAYLGINYKTNNNETNKYFIKYYYFMKYNNQKYGYFEDLRFPYSKYLENNNIIFNNTVYCVVYNQCETKK